MVGLIPEEGNDEEVWETNAFINLDNREETSWQVME